MDLLLNPRQCSEVLHSIEEKLVVEPVSPEARKHLHNELEEVSHAIQELETQAAYINRFAQSYLKELKDTIVTLYGKIDDSALKYRVSLIQKEGLTLEACLQKGDMTSVARLVDTLTYHINSLYDTYAPGLEDRRLIAFARLQLEKASALMEGEVFIDPLTDPEGWTYLQAEEAIETVADLLSQNERRAARLLLNRLTVAQRKLFSAYLNPDDMLARLLHDVESAAHHDQVSLDQAVMG